MGAQIEIPGTARLTAPFDFTTNRRFPLGMRMITADGRGFRYGENDATLEITGNIYQSEVPNAADDAIAVQAAAAVGARTVSLTAGSEAFVVNEFDGGYFMPEDDAGEGFVYIVNNTPAGSASVTVSLSLAHGIEVALTTDTTVMVMKHLGKDVILTAAPPSAAPYGVAVSAIAANRFGWYQHRGLATIAKTGTLVIAQMIEGSGAVVGSSIQKTSNNPTIVGTVQHVGVNNTEMAKIILNID